MKVLNIITSPMIYDGITMSVLGYFENINNDEIHIDFVAPSIDENIKKRIELKNGKVYIIHDRKKHPLKYIKKLSKIIKFNKYDIVHAHGSSAILCLEMIAARLAGCKIRIAHSRNTKCDYKIVDKILRPIFYLTCTNRFACGEKAGKWLFKNKDFIIINNGKDTDKFKFNKKIRNDMRKKYNIEDKIVIGHVGNFNEQKNHRFLIEIFDNLVKKNKEYYLVLIGIGHLRGEIEERAKELGIEKNVSFVGSSDCVEKWLQAMDIMVFPSLFEGFPNVLIEWQIAGIPCVISDVITDEVKITDLVQFKSLEDTPEQWADEINKIKLNNREDKIYIEQIKKAGYDIKENAKRLEKIYIDLAGEKNEKN